MILQVGDKLVCKKTLVTIGVVENLIYEITHIRDGYIRLIHILNNCQKIPAWITEEHLIYFYTQDELRLKKLESL